MNFFSGKEVMFVYVILCLILNVIEVRPLLVRLMLMIFFIFSIFVVTIDMRYNTVHSLQFDTLMILQQADMLLSQKQIMPTCEVFRQFSMILEQPFLYSAKNRNRRVEEIVSQTDAIIRKHRVIEDK